MTSSVSSPRLSATRFRWLVAARGDRLHLAHNSLGLIAGKVASMALGFLFWVVAARVSSAREVGIAAGSVSAMMLGTQLALFGIGAAFTMRLPRDEDQPTSLLNTSITLVAGSAALVAVAMLIVAGLLLKQLSQVALAPTYAALFVAMTVFGTVGILLDQVSVALGRGPQVLSRNTISGLVSLGPLVALPLLLHDVTAMQLFALWVVGGVATCGYGAWQLSQSVSRYRYRPALRKALAFDLVRIGLPNHLLTLSDRVPGLILPVIVTEVLSPSANAHWYVIWMMAWIVYIAPNSFGLALFAEGARRPGSMNDVVRRSVRLAVLVGAGGAAAVALIAEPALRLLGRGYAETGLVPLLILLLAVVPLTFVQSYYAACRARGLLREAVTAGVVTATLATAGTAAAGAAHGLVGMAVAWVAIQSVVGAWAAYRLRWLATAGPSPVRLDAEEQASIVATSLLTEATLGDPAVLAVAAPTMGTSASPTALTESTDPALAKARRRPTLSRVDPLDLIGVAGVALALLVWILSVHQIDTTKIGDLGLVTLLPVPLLVVPAILTLSFVGQLCRRRTARAGVLVLHVLALIVVLYGIYAMVEVVPHNQVAYRHIGIIQTLLQTNHIDGTIDAYFDWPGFFALGALITKAAGLSKPLDLLPWAAVFNNLLYLAPLLLIMRAFTRDWRLRWLAVWIFYLANWVDQDYFSPQGLAYFLFLTVLALVLSYFRPAPLPRWLAGRRVPGWFRGAAHRVAAAPTETALPPGELARRRPVVLILTVVLFAGLVPTHQLTPYAVILALLALFVVNQCSSRRLPVIAIVLTVGWLLIATVPYLQGHLGKLASGVANVSASTQANLQNRVSGPSGHLVVVDIRIAITGVLLLLAAVGFLRRWRRGHLDTAAAVLVMAPFLLFLLQPYGGEVLLRAYYFSLPFSAFLAAAALVPMASGRYLARAFTGVVAFLACAGLLVAFGFARYGNERMLSFTPAEVAGVQHLYEVAPQGSLIIAGSTNTAWRSTGYSTYHYATVTDFWIGHRTAAGVATAVADRMEQIGGTTSYLLLTRSQGEAIDLLGTLPAGSMTRFDQAVSSSPKFRLLWSNRDARIYVLRTPAAR